MRPLALLLLLCAACDDAEPTETADAAPDAGPDAALVDAAPTTVTLSGQAFSFGPGGQVSGATVSVLEHSEITTQTADDGTFSLAGVPAEAEATLVLDDPNRPPIQTGTQHLAGVDLERLTFQAPNHDLYRALAAVVQVTPDPERCQIATTVTRRGNSLFDEIPGTHGEPEATVTIEPEPEGVDGPVYFDLVRYDTIFPSRPLTQTTADGGVLFLNVPPGEYTLKAHKPDTVFADVHIKCRAGFLVNASPPYGLQALEGGVGPRTEPDWQ